MAGTYVGVFVQTPLWIREYVHRFNIPQTQEDRQQLHVTIMHSTNWVPNLKKRGGVHIARPDGFITLEHGEKKVLALKLKCESLEDRFNELVEVGLIHRYPDFIPHITLSYDIGNFDYTKLPRVSTRIALHNEKIRKDNCRYFHSSDYWTRLQKHLSSVKRTIAQTNAYV